MIATEIGYYVKPGDGDDADHYGARITQFLEERGISWMAWVFDPKWGPQLLTAFDGFKRTGSGEFFSKAMHRPPAPLLATPKS